MKWFVIALAAISICALSTEGMYRKCFQVTDAPASSSAPPLVTPDPATIANITNQINTISNTLNSNNLQIANTAATIQNGLSAASNSTPAAKILASGISTTIARLGTATGARRKRDTFTFWTPTTCAGVVSEIQALNTFAQGVYLVSGASGFIDLLNQLKTAISTSFTQLAPLSPSIDYLIQLLTDNSALAANMATYINSLTQFLGVMQVALCASAPSTTTSSFSGATITSTPTCTIGSGTYANDTSLDGILAGTSIDGQKLYIGYKSTSGLNFPGSLETSDALLPGFSYTRNGAVFAFETSSVTYLKQGTSCHCYLVSRTAAIPTGGYLYTVNSGANIYGFGVYTDSVSLSYSYQVVGRINPYTNILYYFDPLTLSEKSSTTFQKLVCVNEAVPTTTVSTATTPGLLLNINQTRDALKTKIDLKDAIMANIADDFSIVIATITDSLTAGNLLSATQISSLTSVLTGLGAIAFPTTTPISLPIDPNDWCNTVGAVITAVPANMNATDSFFNVFHQVIGVFQTVLGNGQVSLSGIGSMIDSFQGVIIAGTISTLIGDFADLLTAYKEIHVLFDYFSALYASSACNLY